MSSIADSRKKRGRPRTGIGEAIGLRLYPDMSAALDEWIAGQPEPQPSRPEAIRQLVSAGLASSPTTGDPVQGLRAVILNTIATKDVTYLNDEDEEVPVPIWWIEAAAALAHKPSAELWRWLFENVDSHLEGERYGRERAAQIAAQEAKAAAKAARKEAVAATKGAAPQKRASAKAAGSIKP